MLRVMPPTDLTDPDLYQTDAFREHFARLRRESPVGWNEETTGGGGWAVTRYDDVVAVSKNPQLFSSAREHGGHRLYDERVRNPTSGATMLSMDPPEHVHHRRMIAPGFTPRRLEAMQARIRERVVTLIDRMQAHGHECDFVSTFAAELPMQVLAELFDAPAEDRATLLGWSNAVIGEDDPDFRKAPTTVSAALRGLGAYAVRLRAERLKKPGDDLITMLAHANVDGAPLTIDRFIATFILLVIAGNETTRNSLSLGVWALTQHPEQKRRLLADPSLLPRAVKEIIRWGAPVLHMRRTALADTELRGVPIRRGDKVVLWYCSANRDETAWPDADAFDVGRTGAEHVGFGTGQHLCLGARLAELQLTLAFEELLARLPGLEVSGPFRKLRSNFLNGPKAMTVRY